MLEKDQEPHICFECDSEFIIHTPVESEIPVSFCPFCGSEVEPTEEDLDDYIIDGDDLDEDKF